MDEVSDDFGFGVFVPEMSAVEVNNECEFAKEAEGVEGSLDQF